MIACSCGIPGCTEKGWPHEWDPLAAGDECVLGKACWMSIFVAEEGDPAHRAHVVIGDGPALEVRHLVREPYVRRGSGYACRSCDEEEGRSYAGGL